MTNEILNAFADAISIDHLNEEQLEIVAEILDKLK